MKVVLATRNLGKVRELQDALSSFNLEVLGLDQFPTMPEVEESGETLEENALLKARAVHAHTQLATLADDTGLEVYALDGKPGVHSARFAGLSATDEQNRAHLLARLDGRTDRNARFRTVLAFVSDRGDQIFEGACEGYILTAERGVGGFGYDALFVPKGSHRTFAEMSTADKYVISHRGKALRAFVAHFGDWR